MINIIAHRGLWNEIAEQNTLVSFHRALSLGFGIETDLRDFNQEIVISHDMSTSDCLQLSKFLEVCDNVSPEALLALNIKSDGLQKELIRNKIKNPHFFFDMSVPDMLGFKKNGLIFYTRYSDIEADPCFYEEVEGVWLDNFSSNQLEISVLKRFLQDGKKVILVSPELHKRDEKKYWQTLKEFLYRFPQYEYVVGICTDFPLKARNYFYDQQNKSRNS